MPTTFPIPVVQKNRRYFWRRDLEKYKAALAGLPYLEDESKPNVLISARQVSLELGFCVRTLGRRLYESRNAEAVSEPEAA
jgi:hypothetical protein